MSSSNAPPSSGGTGGTIDWTSPGSIGSNNPNSVTATDLTTVGRHLDPPISIQTLTAASVITPNATNIPISASSAITLTSNPQISAGGAGQSLTLVNVGGQNITFTSVGIAWGQSTYTLFSGRAITLFYSSTLSTWLPISTIPPDVRLYGLPTVDNQTGNLANGVIANTSYVNQSNRPAVDAYISTTTQTIGNDVYPPAMNIVYNTKTLDTNNAYNPATGIFTVPTGMGGLYQVTAGVYLGLATTTCYIYTYVNGNQYRLCGNGADVSGVTLSTCIVNLNGGDNLTIRLYQRNSSSATLSLLATGNIATLSIYRLNV